MLPGIFKQKWDYNGIANSPSGRQTVQTMFHLNTYEQLTVPSGVGYNIRQSPFATFDMNPFQSTTSTTAPGGTIVARPKTGKIFVKEFDIHFIFSNWGNTEADCELYVFKAKKEAYNPGGINVAYDDPYNAWNKGYADTGLGQSAFIQRKLATSAVQGYGQNQILYAKPGDSRVLKSYHQQVHEESFRLASGQSTRDLTMKIKMNKIFSRDELDKNYQTLNNSVNFLPVGGLTFLLVVRGASVGKAATDLTATVVPAEVGWIAEVGEISKSLAANMTTDRVETYAQTQYADATNVSIMNDVDVVGNDTKV